MEREYVKTYSIAVFCLAWLNCVVLSLFLVPAYCARIPPYISDFHSAPQPLYVLEKKTTEVVWNLSKTIEFQFDLSGRPAGYKIITSFEIFYEGESEDWRITKIRYAFVCNGEKYREVWEDVVGTGHKFGGTYDPPGKKEPIPNDVLREGENNFEFVITVKSWNSTADPGYSRLKLEIINLGVMIRYFPGVENYVGGLVIPPLLAFVGYRRKLRRREC